jgi:hypothetical protein
VAGEEEPHAEAQREEGFFMGRDCGRIRAMEERYGVYDCRRGA